MFGANYFSARYFGARYYGHYGAVATVVDGRYLGSRYFGRRYWNQELAEADGVYQGSRYFGNRYFGRRFFGANQTSDPFELVQTNTLVGAGLGTFSSVSLTTGFDWPFVPSAPLVGTGISSLNATLSFENEVWYLENYLQLATANGTSSFAATFEIGYASGVGRYFGRRYLGSSYYGQRYWGTTADVTFELDITNVLMGVGAATYSANIGQSILLVPAGPILSNGSSSFAATIGYTDQPSVVIPDEAISTGGWPNYKHVQRKKRRKREDEEIEDAVVIVQPEPQSETVVARRSVLKLKPATQAKPIETVADQIERISKDRAKKALKRKRALEEKLLLL
jgi:hypothetical protein